MRFALYVSGHGYGHCTRASALVESLLAAQHEVTIVTNALPFPFSAVLPPADASAASTAAQGPYATYRHALVDAGIVQPKAYDVDRQATLGKLQAFLTSREERIGEEVAWLTESRTEVVLSDATFLGCVAAARAGLPAILITNFTFDSCYSYLSIPPVPLSASILEQPEPAISADLLEPLVLQTIADYSHASLLLRLPGYIPIPSFDLDVVLPSSNWINEARTQFTPTIEAILNRPPSLANGRKIVDVPLIVRSPSKGCYTLPFRAALLSSMDVPISQHESNILLVSFGGQSIPRPKTRPPSPLHSPVISTIALPNGDAHYLAKPKVDAGMLPEGWIAIVCGLSGDKDEIRRNLPDGFYASDRNAHVPDLTALADVVLGKLGYGTCSEAMSCHTPLIYVPRPLFIEEYGLRRLMVSTPSTVQIDREDFEAGRWEFHVLEAHRLGKEGKEQARRDGFVENGAGTVIVEEIMTFLRERKEV